MCSRTETCRFSGLKIYPGRVRDACAFPTRPGPHTFAQGIKLARTDCQVFLFLNAKCKRLFNNKLKASKLAWTALYRKAHKKDQSTEAARRKRRSNKVSQARSIVGASLEVIQKRRNEKSDVRAAARENALRCVRFGALRLCCALTLAASALQRDQGACEEGEGGEAGRQEVRGCQAEGFGAQGGWRRAQGWQGWRQALNACNWHLLSFETHVLALLYTRPLPRQTAHAHGGPPARPWRQLPNRRRT